MCSYASQPNSRGHAKLVDPLFEHLEVVRAQHTADVEEGRGFVELPEALRRKYPSAPREWPWQWVFPATRTSPPAVTQDARRGRQQHARGRALIGDTGYDSNEFMAAVRAKGHETRHRPVACTCGRRIRSDLDAAARCQIWMADLPPIPIATGHVARKFACLPREGAFR